MAKGYLLYHIYEFCNQSSTKFLGLYSTKEKAEEAQQRFRGKEGFNTYPESCFVIDDLEFDKDSKFWGDGFFSTNPSILNNFIYVTNAVNSLAGITDSAEESLKNEDYYDVYCMVSDMIYAEQEVADIGEFIQRMLHDYMNLDLDIETCNNAAQKMINHINI